MTAVVAVVDRAGRGLRARCMAHVNQTVWRTVAQALIRKNAAGMAAAAPAGSVRKVRPV